MGVPVLIADMWRRAGAARRAEVQFSHRQVSKRWSLAVAERNQGTALFRPAAPWGWHRRLNARCGPLVCCGADAGAPPTGVYDDEVIVDLDCVALDDVASDGLCA